MTETNDKTKTKQVKPLPIFSHMPPNVKGIIIKHADPFINESLRRVTKEFKDLCDASPDVVRYLGVNMSNFFGSERVRIEVWRLKRWHTMLFRKIDDKTYNQSDFGTIDHNHQGNYWQAAAEFLHKVTRYRNHTIRSLQIAFEATNEDSFKEEQRLFFHHFLMLLETHQHKFNVDKLSLENHRSHVHAARLVALCKPRTLNFIDISGHQLDRIPAQDAPITTSEQWRLAKEAHTKDIDMTDGFSHFNHFEVCTISMNVLTVDILKNLIEVFRNNPAVSTRHIVFQREKTTEERKALEDYYRTIDSDNRIRLSNSLVTWTESNLSLDMRRVALGQR